MNNNLLLELKVDKDFVQHYPVYETYRVKYSDTKICKNTNNFRTFLANRGIKSNNTPFEIKIMLDFIPFMYNIFCLLNQTCYIYNRNTFSIFVVGFLLFK